MAIETLKTSGKDIEGVIDSVRVSVPAVVIRQYQPSHNCDDDGIWTFSLALSAKQIQIESSSYNCPFVIETDEQCGENALKADDVSEVVRLVVMYLSATSNGSNVWLKGKLMWT